MLRFWAVKHNGKVKCRAINMKKFFIVDQLHRYFSAVISMDNDKMGFSPKLR
jgi:hypothetical protein